MPAVNHHNDLLPSASLSHVARRSALLTKLREFFHVHDFIEVETPLVSREVIPELHIEPFRLADGAFLQASPEAHMKRLLTEGAEAIFQVTRSFRDGERGPLHNPEFTIVEWYRHGDDVEAGMELLDQLCRSLLGTPPAKRSSYSAVFERRIGLCPHTCPIRDLESAALSAGIHVPDDLELDDRDGWLNLLLALGVERTLGNGSPEIVFDYPASQAALATIRDDPSGHPVAERFELYWRGVELANGYRELADADELRQRLVEVNRARVADGHSRLPLPERLLAAMETGMPDCTGCALGFDRLVMLAAGAQSIGEVMPFPADQA